MLIVTSGLQIKAATPAQRSNLVLLKSATSRQVAGRSQPASWMSSPVRLAHDLLHSNRRTRFTGCIQIRHFVMVTCSPEQTRDTAITAFQVMAAEEVA